MSYSSQVFRLQPGALTENAVVDIPSLDRPEGVGLIAYEDGTAIVTVIGIAGKQTPTDLPTFLDSVAKFLPPHANAALRSGVPVGDVAMQKYPASVWRRYHKLNRFPEGYLVLGDAVCSFNPMYGQGMTSAALQALALRECLAFGTDELSQRYFRSSAKKLSPIWWANRFTDFTIAPSDGWRSKLKRLVNLGMDKVYVAATSDVYVAETIFRRTQMLDQPTAFMRPTMMRRIIAGNRRSAAERITAVNGRGVPLR